MTPSTVLRVLPHTGGATAPSCTNVVRQAVRGPKRRCSGFTLSALQKAHSRVCNTLIDGPLTAFGGAPPKGEHEYPPVYLVDRSTTLNDVTDMEWIQEPRLRDPVAVLAFEGWNDAANAATGVVEYLISSYCEGPFAQLDLENYMNFQMSRPLVSIDGGIRQMHWPATGFFEIRLPDHSHDIVAVLGEEPHLRWPSYCRQVISTLRDLGVERAVTFGAFIGQVPHTLPIQVFGVSTDEDFPSRLGVSASSYEGPTGITGVIHAALAVEGIDAASLWAAIPHYLAANPSPKGTQALLGKLADLVEYEFDTSAVDREVTEYDKRVSEAIEESSDFLAYVRELEKGSTTAVRQEISPAESQQLVEEIERFLRDPG